MEQSTSKIIGEPMNRVDGPAKVTGRAEYAGDHQVEGGIAGGCVGGVWRSSRRLLSVRGAVFEAWFRF